MVDTPNPQITGDLHKHRPVIDVNRLLGLHLGAVQGQLVEVHIRFANMHKARGDEEVHKSPQVADLMACLKRGTFLMPGTFVGLPFPLTGNQGQNQPIFL
jgi:hypothetical protein